MSRYRPDGEALRLKALEHLSDVRGADSVNFSPGCRIPTNPTVKLPISAYAADWCEPRDPLGKGQSCGIFAWRFDGRCGQRLLLRHAGHDGDDVYIMLTDCDV